MKVERQFNKRSAPLVECQQPVVQGYRGDVLGVYVCLYPHIARDSTNETGVLRMHLAPKEALLMAQHLIAGAQEALRQAVPLDGRT